MAFGLFNLPSWCDGPWAAARKRLLAHMLVGGVCLLGVVGMAQAEEGSRVLPSPPTCVALGPGCEAYGHGLTEDDHAPQVGVASLGVVVNVQDPRSVELARVYMRERGIAAANLVAVSFSPGQQSIAPATFKALYREAIESLGPRIQALVLTWRQPYRVGCMSVTSAFALGYDPAYCASGCELTKPLPYFGSATRSPWSNMGLRPTMMLAAESFDEVTQLIARGIQADASHPGNPQCFVLQTSDPHRGIRGVRRPAGAVWRVPGAPDITLQYVRADSVRRQSALLSYTAGTAHVSHLLENHFLPGAVGDHLTSYGAVMEGNTGQMNVLKWISGGATGTYGTVTEPCNYVQKFPDPEVFLSRYAQGDTLVEAYWKSVLMPGQGLFVGEPLARPFGPSVASP